MVCLIALEIEKLPIPLFLLCIICSLIGQQDNLIRHQTYQQQRQQQQQRRTRRAATNIKSKLWENGLIPFSISKEFSGKKYL